MRTVTVAGLALSVLGLRAGAAGAGPEPAADRWTCPILPPEHEASNDPLSGARVVFVTNHAADDVNLYFHENSWLADESMLVFMSSPTGRSEPFGYLEAAGHLVRLNPEGRPVPGAITCSRRGPRLYGVRDGGSSYGPWRWSTDPSRASGSANERSPTCPNTGACNRL